MKTIFIHEGEDLDKRAELYNSREVSFGIEPLTALSADVLVLDVVHEEIFEVLGGEGCLLARLHHAGLRLGYLRHTLVRPRHLNAFLIAHVRVGFHICG